MKDSAKSISEKKRGARLPNVGNEYLSTTLLDGESAGFGISKENPFAEFAEEQRTLATILYLSRWGATPGMGITYSPFASIATK